ncbi:NADH-quinone oxidoreductase subunit NuoG [Candidatus Methylocalor cossyra]|uniref:NADH-quinone oxidoreductase n=1 Tax=Candidatus Methylocalor cossyra TaxID=3108543 RepID=A0ABM9NGT6_9GAMM
MAKIILDGVEYQVEAGENLLKTCLSLGLDLPYFCWHPALGSVGACRQCAVVHYKDQHDTRGRLVMACMTPVTDGLRAALEAPEAREFRAGIIEFLMTNHPHDCPVCEEGGECHLQDMTVMTGHTLRRYRGLKRTYRNQDLGPFINHEMNRCIACYRCVRFYGDYAGGTDLQVFSIRNQVYFGRFEDGTLENEFSGNLVEVCPTGVFTDRTFSAHYVRKWDLRYAPSVCVHCAVGCNISPGERLGTLRRIINRYHGEVNGYFLCDRGRFGYGFVNGGGRLRQVRLLDERVGPDSGIAHLAGLACGRAIGIGSPRASLEANFALRELVGAANFYAGLSRTEAELVAAILDILRHWPVRVPALREVEQADAVLVLGEDPTQTAPRLALALRQAVRNRAFRRAEALKIPVWLDAAVREAAQAERSPLFVATPAISRLDDVAEAVYRGTPEDLARLGFAVARALHPAAPAVADLGEGEQRLVETIAAALAAARRPLIVAGTGCLSLALVQAAANLARALSEQRQGQPVDLCYIVPECNTLGLALMEGRHLEDAFAAVESGAIETAIVLENDLYRRAEPLAVERFFGKIKHLAVIDHTRHGTAERAELQLPCGTFAETEGTLVSLEGRAQRFFSVMPTQGDARDDWRWPVAALRRNWNHLDAVTAACAAALPVFAPILRAAPGAAFRIDGAKVPREPARFSGRTAMLADRRLHEPKPPDDPDSPLSYTMEGVSTAVPSALIPVDWAPRWNSHQQAATKFQDQAGGHLRGGDPGVRLIEPPEQPEPRWFDPVPSDAGDGRWRVVPLYHIFGSEELSARSAPLAERMPAPYAALHPDAIAELGLAHTVQVNLDDRTLTLPVKPDASLPRHAVGLPRGLPELPLAEPPPWVALSKTGAAP